MVIGMRLAVLNERHRRVSFSLCEALSLSLSLSSLYDLCTANGLLCLDISLLVCLLARSNSQVVFYTNSTFRYARQFFSIVSNTVLELTLNISFNF